MFSGKHSFSKTQLVKNTFSPKPKNTVFFPKQGVILGFGRFPLKPLFLLFFLGFHCFGPQKKCAKQKVCTKMRPFFSLPDTNGVRRFLLKILVIFLIFGYPPLKTQFYIFGHFPFLFSFGLSCGNIKRQKQKCIFFENLIFDIPTILRKHYFGTN